VNRNKVTIFILKNNKGNVKNITINIKDGKIENLRRQFVCLFWLKKVAPSCESQVHNKHTAPLKPAVSLGTILIHGKNA